MLVTRPVPEGIDFLAVHRLDPRRYPLLLESSATSSAQGRWDILLAASGESLRLDADGVTRDGDDVSCDGDFLSALDRRWQARTIAHGDPKWPFRGGWALYLGYGLAAQVEPVLALARERPGWPVATALRCPAALLRDHRTGACVAIAEAGHVELLDRLVADCAAAGALPAMAPWRPPVAIDEDDPDAFVAGVGRVLDYLVAGDVFQVNLSRQWQARFERPLDPAALFARLRQYNPAPFAGLFAHDGHAVVSASPERLVSVRGDTVETRPIAGTCPRFEGDDDVARIDALVGHPKERAEHVMLIDLERNDLGRVCEPGSIHVDELMGVESYPHVHHIVSNVRGRLRSSVTPGAVIRAVFPGGTITGCPKVRCMQIIAELEACSRGAYTGAFGWLNRDGDLDLNILIRGAEVDGDTLRFRTGAGIVADSDPVRELDETRAKARGMLHALGVSG
jgi:anthranilate synthase component 1